MDAFTAFAATSPKRSICADEMYPTICVECAVNHFGLGLT